MTTTLAWRRCADRYGNTCYVLPDGTIVRRDGAGRFAWTVYYRDHMRDGIPSYGMTTTLAEAKAWGEAP